MTFLTSFAKIGGGISLVVATDIAAKKIQEEYGETIERRIKSAETFINSSTKQKEMVETKVQNIIEIVDNNKSLSKEIHLTENTQSWADYIFDCLFLGTPDYKISCIEAAEKSFKGKTAGSWDYFWYYYNKFWFHKDTMVRIRADNLPEKGANTSRTFNPLPDILPVQNPTEPTSLFSDMLTNKLIVLYHQAELAVFNMILNEYVLVPLILICGSILLFLLTLFIKLLLWEFSLLASIYRQIIDIFKKLSGK